MKRLTMLVCASVWTLIAQGQTALRLTEVNFVEAQMNYRYAYDTKGRIAKITVNQLEQPITIDYDQVGNATLMVDTLAFATIGYDPMRQVSTAISIYFLNSDVTTPIHYDAKNRFLGIGSDSMVVYAKDHIVAVGDSYKALTYPQTNITEVARLTQAIPYFIGWLNKSDATDTYACLLPLIHFGTAFNACPTSATMTVDLPEDPLEEALNDSPSNPFYNIIDARSQHLMDVEAVKPSMQLEQAISEHQATEEQWLTLTQFDELMRDIMRYYREAQKEDEAQTATRRVTLPVTFHYTILSSQQPKQHLLQVDIKGPSSERPEAIRMHKTIRFTLEE